MSHLPQVPPMTLKQSASLIQRRFEVVTPVFGGGVFIDKDRGFDKEIDRVTPVRVSGIIGQLRYWWRAIEGVRYRNGAELFEAEGLLWGTSEAPGLVELWVEGQPTVRETPRFKKRSKEDKREALQEYAYGVFPLENTQNRKGEGGRLFELEGEVTLCARLNRADETQKAIVELVIDVWLAFGGIGGRTRRGFGAVSPSERSAPSLDQLMSRVEARRVSDPTFHELVPTLHHPKGGVSLTALRTQAGTAKAAHTSALRMLSDFRQGLTIGRRRKQGAGLPQGRSYWPEPDEIRRITRRYTPNHKPMEGGPRGFPRSRFGMPVITHFKDERQGEPKQSHLTPEGKDRMGSPLIIKPWRSGGGTQFKALAISLCVPGIEGVQLQLKSDNQTHHVSARFEGSDRVPAMAHNTPHGDDPLTAFMNFFQTHQR